MSPTTGRTCGACSLCCKLLEIDDPALTKPAGQWCQHCRPGKGGCGVYETRPRVCRTYGCQWLVSAGVSEAWFPARSRMVLTTLPGRLSVTVDPGAPDMWRKPLYHADLRGMALQGLAGVPGYFLVTVSSRQRWVVLPDRDLDLDLSKAPITALQPFLSSTAFGQIVAALAADVRARGAS